MTAQTGEAAKSGWARRSLVLVLAYLPAVALIVLSPHLPGHGGFWVGFGGFLLLLAAVGLTWAGTRGRFPYPDSRKSWAAVGNEALAVVIQLVAYPILLLFDLALLIVLLLLRLARMRVRPYRPGWLVLWRAVAGRLTRSLTCHRAAANEMGELSPATVDALRRVHHALMTANGRLREHLVEREVRRAGWQYREGARSTNEAMRRQVAAQARLALFHAGRFALTPARREWTRLEAHLMLAATYLAASLEASADQKTRLREAGLASLAEAVEMRWLSSPLARPVRRLMSESLSRLQQTGRQTELQEDTRASALFRMLAEGTTAAELAQIRARTHPEPDPPWPSLEGKEEVDWAQALISGDRTAATASLPANDAALLPAVSGWNWGAFFFTWIWAFAHRLPAVGLPLLMLWMLLPFPLFLIPAAYVGSHGSALAWRARPFRSVEEFQATERVWAKWGIFLFIFTFLLSPLFVALVLAAIMARAGHGR